MLLILPGYSRSGNFFFHIINCINDNIHHYNHYEISLKMIKQNSPLFSNIPETITFPEFINCSDNEIVISKIFSYKDVIVKTKEHEYDLLVKKYIKPYINNDFISENIPNKTILPTIDYDNDLIIHVRSGDVFEKNKPFNKKMDEMFSCFVSPPYIFYKNIIEKYKFKNIFIISENFNLNPIINKLLENYKTAVFLTNDLITDFSILMKAKHFIPGHSDLSRVAILLSDVPKNIYISKRIFPNNSNINTIYFNYESYYNNKPFDFDAYLKNIINYNV